jgi:hypothetical protein
VILGYSLAFGLFWLALAAALHIVAVQPFLRTPLPARAAAISLASLMMLVGFLAIATEVQTALDRMGKKVLERGPSALSRFECSGIWLFGLAMSAGGYLSGYPEAAEEQLAMYFPGPDVRPFEGDLAMSSEQVRAKLAAFAAILPTRGSREVIWLPSEHLVFPPNSEPPRVTFAFGIMEIRARAVGPKDGWRIDVTGRAPIRYPPRSRTPLFRAAGRSFYVEEALFFALQERGWIFPYTAEWHWALFSDDPRLGGAQRSVSARSSRSNSASNVSSLL